jgi:hypothetical protein
VTEPSTATAVGLACRMRRVNSLRLRVLNPRTGDTGSGITHASDRLRRAPGHGMIGRSPTEACPKTPVHPLLRGSSGQKGVTVGPSHHGVRLCLSGDGRLAMYLRTDVRAAEPSRCRTRRPRLARDRLKRGCADGARG